MNIQHFCQDYDHEPQLGYLVIYQVFAATIKQLFLVWILIMFGGGKIRQSFKGYQQTFEV